MRVYVDSSVLLRIALGEADALPEWGRIASPSPVSLSVSSACAPSTVLASRPGWTIGSWPGFVRMSSRSIDAFTLVRLDDRIKSRAAEPFPTLLRTLHALHLASALAMRESGLDLSMATHDRELGVAAEALGFEVIG